MLMLCHPELSGCITTLIVRNTANFCAAIDTLIDQDDVAYVYIMNADVAYVYIMNADVACVYTMNADAAENASVITGAATKLIS